MKVIFVLAFVSCSYILGCKASEEDESNELNWREFKTQIPSDDGLEGVDIQVAYFSDNQVIGLAVKDASGFMNGTYTLMDFGNGYSATVDEDEKACLVTKLPEFVDYDSHQEYLEDAWSDSDNVLSSMYCEYELSLFDLSVYGEWIDSFCGHFDANAIVLKECYPLEEDLIQDVPSYAIMALQKSCLVIAYAVDFAQDGRLACIRGGYSSHEKFSSQFRFGNGDKDEPNGFLQGFIHAYLETHFMSADVLLIGDDFIEPYQGAVFVDLFHGISGMINYYDEEDHLVPDACAFTNFRAPRSLMDFVQEFQNPENGVVFHSCHSRLIENVTVYNSAVLTTVCDDKPSYLLENCTHKANQEADKSCMFMGVIYNSNGQAELACVSETYNDA